MQSAKKLNAPIAKRRFNDPIEIKRYEEWLLRHRFELKKTREVVQRIDRTIAEDLLSALSKDILGAPSDIIKELNSLIDEVRRKTPNFGKADEETKESLQPRQTT